jgi:molybdopterin synthase catalytic subunit
VISDIRLLTGPFDAAAETDRFLAANADAGGIASFIGKVRPGGGVEALELSHYGPLTLPGMEALAAEVERRWAVTGLLIIHRSRMMLPGEAIVLVAAAAHHRREAIEAVDFAMDHLKGDSWFWKREKRAGLWHWIEPRERDFSDLARWEEKSAS